jgi:NADPH:quinone reductase-like Zn-dependent oxidoreductase
MKAVEVREYGTPEVLQIHEIATPQPAPHEVLIRVAAASVNPADWLLRSGGLRFFTKLPFVLGSDVAGVVASVGSAVKEFQPGDAVYSMLPTNKGGGYAEYAVADAAHIARIPANLTFIEAAAVPLTALTALQYLQKAELKPGQQILINGAAGGVGSFAVQIAKAMGAQVTGTASSRNQDFICELGADTALNYESPDFLYNGQWYDVIFDTANVLRLPKVRHALKPNGLFLSVNPIAGNPLSKLAARLRGRRVESLLVKPSGEDLALLSTWLQQGTIRPIVDQTYALEDVAMAHQRSETKHVRGKLVLVVDPTLEQQRTSERLSPTAAPLA